MSQDVSSLVIDSLCDQARGQNVAVVCFCFNFVARKEQSSASMLQTTSPEKPTCINTLLVDERMAAHRAKLPNSLN